MKRDMDLVRQILLACEACDPEEELLPVPTILDCTRTQVCYHIHLMGQAGLLIVVDQTHMSSPCPQAALLSVTWAGHDFIDNTKSSAVWTATKEAAKKAGGVGFDLLIQIAKYEAKQQLKKIGVDLAA